MSNKIQGCPNCGQNDVVEIVYGLPGLELTTAAMRGDVRIGGCCISPESPTHACKACDHEWIGEGASAAE